MKAIVQDEYGSPDVLELRDIDKPEIADEEVLVGVHAAGVDRSVWHIMTGLPYAIRIGGYGLRAPKNPVLGMRRVALLLTRSHRRCTILAQKSSSWVSVDAPLLGMVQLHCKPL